MQNVAAQPTKDEIVKHSPYCDTIIQVKPARCNCGAEPHNVIASQPPDPKLSIVEEFDKFNANPENHENCYECDGALLERKIKPFLLAALEAHGKAERLQTIKEQKQYYWYEILPREIKDAHAAGFTEGVEKSRKEFEAPAHTKAEWVLGSYGRGFMAGIEKAIEAVKDYDKEFGQKIEDHHEKYYADCPRCVEIKQKEYFLTIFEALKPKQ